MLDKSRAAADKKRKHDEIQGDGKDTKTIGRGIWKKKLQKVMKTQNGFKTIMFVLAAEESNNQAVINALLPTSPPTANATTTTANASTVTIAASLPTTRVTKAFPAASLKLDTILKKRGN